MGTACSRSWRLRVLQHCQQRHTDWPHHTLHACTTELCRDKGGALFGGVAHSPWKKTGTFYGRLQWWRDAHTSSLSLPVWHALLFLLCCMLPCRSCFFGLMSKHKMCLISRASSSTAIIALPQVTMPPASSACYQWRRCTLHPASTPTYRCGGATASVRVSLAQHTSVSGCSFTS